MSDTDPPPQTQEDLARKVDIMNRLVETSLVMNRTFQLPALLEYLMNIATDMTGSESASIMLLDENTGDLKFASATGESSQKLIGMVVPLEGSIAGTVASEGRALIIDQAKKDPRHFSGTDEAIDFQTRSILGVPMSIREKLIGVLEVINKRAGDFTKEDLWYITILASQAAVAIDNARMVRSLEVAYENLNQLNKLKTDFIAIASHELRTPLGVILGYATFLKDESQGETSALAQAVLDSALQMRTLIEGMTNLRYVQIDENELCLETVPVDEIMTTAYSDVLSLAEARGQLFVFHPPGKPAPIVFVDKLKIILALTNVLHNAIKFTPQGGAIILSAEMHPREVWIKVRDNGCGIEKDELEKIFEQFYQVEDPLTRRHGGLGLGLAIARAVITRHGGRIWAQSPGPGEGCCFTLALPLHKGSPGA